MPSVTRNTPRLPFSASTLMGTRVHTHESTLVGHVRDFVIDVDTGRLLYAVLDPAETLALSGRFVPVPWEALTLSTQEHALQLAMAPHRLVQAPTFASDAWPHGADDQFNDRVYAFFGFE
ncbi:MAG: PRC-barrel domain-containing protein, partial [Bacteroidota bacterium]